MPHKVACWIKVSDEALSDIKVLNDYLNNLRILKAKLFNKINLNTSRAAMNYATVVLELIEAKKQIQNLKKQLHNANKNSNNNS